MASLVLVTPLCLLRNIESLGPTSTCAQRRRVPQPQRHSSCAGGALMHGCGAACRMGACCVLFTSVVISIQGIDDPETDPRFEAHALNWRLTAFQAIPIVCFATMCHFTVVPATAALRPYFEPQPPFVTDYATATDPAQRSAAGAKRGGRVIVMLCISVMVWCNLLYVPVGVLGYRAFGSQSSSNILDNFGQKPAAVGAHFVPETAAVLVARACMMTTTCLSYPIFTFITRMAIVDVLSGGDSQRRSINHEGGSLAAQISTARHCVITVVFLALCAVCGVAVVLADISLGFTVSVIGATVVVAVEFFIPAAMCRSMGRTFSALVFGLVGLVVLTLGLFVTVADEACGDAETEFCKAVGA